MKRTWKFITRLRSGHRIFQHEAGAFAFADNSGAQPDDCDDGPLWFETRHPLRLNATSVSAPVFSSGTAVAFVVVAVADLPTIVELVPHWTCELSESVRDVLAAARAVTP